MKHDIPLIVRAREFHLYAQNGKRYTDFYQDGGRALMGHRPPRLSVILKAVINKGLYAPYPSIHWERLDKTLLRHFPATPYWRFFADRSCAEEFIGESFADPLFSDTGRASLWRPFVGSVKGSSVIAPILPLPGMGSTALLLFDKDPGETLPFDLSPLFLAALIRTLDSLPQLDKRREIPHAEFFDTLPWWERKGWYLLYRESSYPYGKIFGKMAGVGILISPDPRIPSIIPETLGLGDVKALKVCLQKLEGFS